jgi:hypothetical protein
MTNQQWRLFKDLAHSANMECCIDNDGDIALSAMVFDDEGRRQVTYRPDPVDYTSVEEAFTQLGRAISKLEAHEVR